MADYRAQVSELLSLLCASRAAVNLRFARNVLLCVCMYVCVCVCVCVCVLPMHCSDGGPGVETHWEDKCEAYSREYYQQQLIPHLRDGVGNSAYPYICEIEVP